MSKFESAELFDAEFLLGDVAFDGPVALFATAVGLLVPAHAFSSTSKSSERNLMLTTGIVQSGGFFASTALSSDVHDAVLQKLWICVGVGAPDSLLNSSPDSDMHGIVYGVVTTSWSWSIAHMSATERPAASETTSAATATIFIESGKNEVARRKEGERGVASEERIRE